MKTAFILATIFMTTGLFASETLVCGTQNQWPEGDKSGWFLNIHLKTNVAHVVKAEDAETTRSYDYTVNQINGAEFTLASPYGDEINMQRSGRNVFFAYHVSEGKKEEFTLTCVESLGISAIENEALNINKKLSVYRNMQAFVKENPEKDLVWKKTTNESVPFTMLAQGLKFSISDIGDWEETILNPSQEEKIRNTLGKNTDFKKFTKGISRDLKQDPRLKQLGLLFARDWYTGEGFVGFVFSYDKQVFVLPFAFEVNVKFGDDRLDYIY